MAGTVVDVTERKEAEERVREAAAYSPKPDRGEPRPARDHQRRGQDHRRQRRDRGGDRRLPRPPRRHRLRRLLHRAREGTAGYRQVLATGSVRDYPLRMLHASGRSTEVLYNATTYRDAGRCRARLRRGPRRQRAPRPPGAGGARLPPRGDGDARRRRGARDQQPARRGAGRRGRGARDRTLSCATGSGGAIPSTGKPRSAMLGDAVEALEEAQESGLRIARVVKGLTTFGQPEPAAQPYPTCATSWPRRCAGCPPRWRARPASVSRTRAHRPWKRRSARIEQVVVNLVTNAARAIPKGRRGVVVVRTGPGTPGMARLEVVDDGKGIEPAEPGTDLRALLHHPPDRCRQGDGARPRDLPLDRDVAPGHVVGRERGRKRVDLPGGTAGRRGTRKGRRGGSRRVLDCQGRPVVGSAPPEPQERTGNLVRAVLRRRPLTGEVAQSARARVS